MTEQKLGEKILTPEERMNVDIPCESCDSSRNLGHMNIGSVECLDCAVEYYLKAQDAKTYPIAFEDGHKIGIAKCQARVERIKGELEKRLREHGNYKDWWQEFWK